MELSLKWNYGVEAFLHGVFFIWENIKTKLEVFLTFQKLNLVYIWDVVKFRRIMNGAISRTYKFKF